MFEVIYMKADYEPWWMFEGWEETVLTRHSFEEEEPAKKYLYVAMTKLRKEYPCEGMKKDCFFAFWSEHEKIFCEACDEDSQIYHGLILMCDGKPFTLEK